MDLPKSFPSTRFFYSFYGNPHSLLRMRCVLQCPWEATNGREVQRCIYNRISNEEFCRKSKWPGKQTTSFQHVGLTAWKRIRLHLILQRSPQPPPPALRTSSQRSQIMQMSGNVHGVAVNVLTHRKSFKTTTTTTRLKKPTFYTQPRVPHLLLRGVPIGGISNV